jgi:hypothetical protein
MITCYTNEYMDPTRTTKPTLSPLHDEGKEKKKTPAPFKIQHYTTASSPL